MDNKSKQIAYLAFFKSLCMREGISMEDVTKKSEELVEYLANKYPLGEYKPVPIQQTPLSPQLSNVPMCPKCGKFMMPNLNKTSEKSPDWKCSDKNCKWQKNFKTNEWEPSKYITSAWNEDLRREQESRAEDSMWDEASHNF